MKSVKNCTEEEVPGSIDDDLLIDFDLESYISRYSPDSETRLQRLLFIAQAAAAAAAGSKLNSKNPQLADSMCNDRDIVEEKHMDISDTSFDSNEDGNDVNKFSNTNLLVATAYKLAITHMKAHGNVTKYKELFGINNEELDDYDDDKSNNATSGENNQDGTNNDIDNYMDSTPAPKAAFTTKANTKPPPRKPPSTAIILQKLGIKYDEEWIYQTENNQQIQLETLESRLSSAQAHLNKDAIRNAFFSLSDFYRKSGRLKQAMKYLVHARDYCSSMIVPLCLDICILGIDMGDWRMVDVYSKKADNVVSTSAAATSTGNDNSMNMRSTGAPSESRRREASGSTYGTSFSYNAITLAKIHSVNALAHLNAGQYAKAALKFASISPELGNNTANSTNLNDSHTSMSRNTTTDPSQFHNVIVPEDIALYGSILALASLDRNTLRATILESNTFQQRLELIPKMRDALRFIDRADYGKGLKLLYSMEKDMRLDIHLSSHVDNLFAKIKERCMVLYFYPYSCISMRAMKDSFYMDSIEEVEEMVEKLILEGKIIGARINAKDGTLRRDGGVEEKRGKLVRRVKRMGDRFMGDVESMMLRLSCLEQDLVVQPDRVQRWKNPRSSRGNDGSATNTGSGSSGDGIRNGNEPMLEEGSSEEEDVVMMDM